MLTISRRIVEQIVAQARAEHPQEACGVVAGAVGSDRPTRVVPLRNAAESTTFYEVDSADLLCLYRELDRNGEAPVVIYHSHTATAAFPSATDVALAAEPETHYVLVSTRETGREPGPYELRSYRIVDGEVTEEDIRLEPEH